MTNGGILVTCSSKEWSMTTLKTCAENGGISKSILQKFLVHARTSHILHIVKCGIAQWVACTIYSHVHHYDKQLTRKQVSRVALVISVNYMNTHEETKTAASGNAKVCSWTLVCQCTKFSICSVHDCCDELEAVHPTHNIVLHMTAQESKCIHTRLYHITRNAFCGTWYLPHSHVHNERTFL